MTHSPIYWLNLSDEVLCNLPNWVGARVGGSILVLAFADDLILCARTPATTHAAWDSVHTNVGMAGLVINMEKSVIMAIVIDAKLKWYVVDAFRMLSLRKWTEPECTHGGRRCKISWCPVPTEGCGWLSWGHPGRRTEQPEVSSAEVAAKNGNPKATSYAHALASACAGSCQRWNPLLGRCANMSSSQVMI